MKKASLLVLAMSLFAVSQAQIRFGARAGLNISNIVGKSVEGWKSKAGFLSAASVKFPFFRNSASCWMLLTKFEGEKQDIKEYLKMTEFSWVIGAGYYVTPQIGVHARYNAGLSSFYESEKNSVFQTAFSTFLARPKSKELLMDG